MTRPARGSMALEFALVVPVMLTVFIGGFTLTRGLLTKHRLIDAASVTARSMAIEGHDQSSVARGLVVAELGGEARLCGSSLRVSTQRVAGAFPGGSALRIDVACNFSGGFGLPDFPVSATATFPF